MQAVVIVLLGILYLTACIAVVLVVGVPATLVLGPLAAAVGALGAVGLIASAYVGTAGEQDLPADDGVPEHVLPGHPAAVEPAWRHYLAHQWSLDAHGAHHRLDGAVRRMWRVVHDRVSVPFADFPFVLWPLAWVPYVVAAAATLGAAAAGLTTALVVGVPAALVRSVRAGVSRVLRRRERRRLCARRAAATCVVEGCDEVSDHPVVQCRCGRRHHRLEPGLFGALRRRCTCGHLLPATVTEAARTLVLRCPRCDGPLPGDALAGADIRVAVVGAVGSGRSGLAADGIEALRRAVIQRGGRCTDVHAAQRPVELERTCRTVRVTRGRRAANVHVYDPVGDVLDVSARLRRLHHLRHAQAFVLTVDAPSLPGIAERVPGQDRAADPEHAYRAVVSHLRDDGVHLGPRTLAVVLRRLDPVRSAGLAAPQDGTSGTVRDWLVANGAENLVVAAARDFGSVRYFAPGAQAESDDDVAGAALAWSVAHAGFAVVWPPRTAR